MPAPRTFAIRYGVFRPLLSVLGIGPAFSGVEVDDGHVRAHMGWAFRTEVPRRSITRAAPFTGLVGGIGVHGWRGRWLVNGGTKGVVSIDIDPPARARVLGVPVRLRALRVGVEAPDALLEALRP